MPRRSPFVLAAILACAVFLLFPIGPTSAPAFALQADQASDGASNPNSTEDQSGKPASADTDVDKETPGDTRPDWIRDIDDKFGEYLVKPLNAVLFYDFGTGNVTDASGNVTRKGWAGISIPFVVVWLLAGATFFTLRMRFINLRAFRHAVRLVRGDFDDPDETGEVSHFQALSSALSATVGLGNIAGVAIAIGTGGPGATFWMILIGLLGMTSKFTECTLGQMYRKVAPDGTISGGAMHYLRDGLAEMKLKPLGKVLAFLFTILCIGASFGGGNAFQVGQSLDAVRTEVALLDNYPWIYGLTLSLFVGVVIIGGIRSIGAVASKIVPFMCAAYVLMALYIIFTNYAKIDDAFISIIHGAFNPDSIKGGILGVMVIGIKRAVFSNEAGTGSAAIAHSAAKTEEPVSEGIVALLEPFIDTVVVCTMTALVIIITGVANPENQTLIDGNSGAALTALAVEQGHVWFKWILFMAVVLFAYSTLISWSYYGERCWAQLFGNRSSIIYKGIFLVFTFLGSIVTRGNILDFSDMLLLGMAIPNILGLYFMSGKVKRALDDYWGRVKSGEIKPHGQA